MIYSIRPRLPAGLSAVLLVLASCDRGADSSGPDGPAGPRLDRPTAASSQPARDEHVGRSEAARARGDLATAESELRAALALQADNAYLHAGLARILAMKQEFEPALSSIRRALEIDPAIPEGRSLSATILMSLQRWEDAGREIDQWIAQSPDAPEPWIEKAQLAIALRDLGGVESAFREALRRRPGWPPAAIGLARVLSTRGKAPEGVGVLREAARTSPAELPIKIALAWQLATNPDEAARNGAEALQLLRDADVKLDVAPPDYLQALAAALAETGKFEDAVKTAELAVAKIEPLKIPQMLDRARKELESYRGGKPCRDDD